MARLPLNQLNDDQFEEFCAEFLRSNGCDVEPFGKQENNNTIDFRARVPVGNPALEHTETWWVQCRGWKGRRINERDLILATSKALSSDECDAFVVMTKRGLTQTAKAWIQARQNRHPKIFYFDDDVLSDLLVAMSDFPLAKYFDEWFEQEPPDPETIRAYVNAASSLWPANRERQEDTREDVVTLRLQENLAAFREAHPGKFGPAFDVAYASQRHEIHYLDNGWISIRYWLTLINLGAKILRSDSLTITPREPIAIEDMQLIITEPSSSQRLAHRLVVETAQLKRIEVEIPHGLAPRSTFSYEANFRLRCQSLEGDQFFEMPTWALTRDVSFMVFIPAPSKVKNAMLLRDHQDASEYDAVQPESQGNGNVLAGEIRGPNIYDVPCISFYVEPIGP